MKRLVSMTIALALLVVTAGVALAFMGTGRPMGMGMGPGAMGGGPANCPGLTATPQAQVTEEQAKELAQKYAETYLKGFTVERLLPFTGMHHTMYNVELKGPTGETRTLHVNPQGNVIPFGGPLARTE
jgi:uncharacterized transporter YbjL